MTPPISIVIPTRNDAAALARTVEWLCHLPGIREAELIVAASGDPLGTIRAVRGRMQLLWPGGSTRAALMNAGAASARGEVLFFVHADSLPPVNALPLIGDALSNDRVVGGAFEHRFAESHWSLRAISGINRIRYELTRNYYGDQGLFVRANTFRALGGYRDLPLLKDLDFSRRLKRRGRTVLVRAPVITSGRRFLANGPWRTFFFIVWLLSRYSLRLGTARYAERWRGPADLSPGSPWPSDRRRTGTWHDVARDPANAHRRGVFPCDGAAPRISPSSRRTGETHAAGGRR
jgi:rSAM/selenodomain-associated transferase 2